MGYNEWYADYRNENRFNPLNPIYTKNQGSNV